MRKQLLFFTLLFDAWFCCSGWLVVAGLAFVVASHFSAGSCGGVAFLA